MGIEMKLQQLKARAERAKTEHARAEAQLESVERQYQEVLDQLAEMGVDPDRLDDAIAETDAEINDLVRQAEMLLEGLE